MSNKIFVNILKLLKSVILFSFFITITVFLISHFIESIWGWFVSPLRSNWGLWEYIIYFGNNVAINIIFLLIFALLFIILFYILGEISNWKIFSEDKIEKGLSFSIAILIFPLFIYPINHHYLPDFYNVKSIVVNIVLVITMIIVATGMYFLLNRLYKYKSKVINGILWVFVGVTLLIIIFSLCNNQRINRTSLLKKPDIVLKNRPDILIITIDALRADHLTCYGYDKINTVNIDDFAEDGIIFTKAYSNSSWTTPSMMSMLTGKYPTIHGCKDYAHSVPEDMIMLSQVLNSFGYRTEAIIGNKALSYRFGFSRGFDRFQEYGSIWNLRFFEETYIYNLIKMLIGNVLRLDNTTWITDRFKDIVETENEEPLFLWVHYLDPHSPYTPPEDYIPDAYEPSKKTRRFLKSSDDYYSSYSKENLNSLLNLYDGEILYVDDMIGDVFKIMKNRGRYDSSLIIVTADHGEEFWEHGVWFHGKSLYMQEVHIPFILKLPEYYGALNEIKKNDTPISLTCIPRTILDFLGIEGYEQFGDISILDILKGDRYEEGEIFSEGVFSGLHLKKLISDEYSFIYNTKTEEEELYNIKTDPEELVDISGENLEKCLEFEDKMKGMITDLEVEKEFYGNPEQVELDEETLEEMRGLGYIE